MTGWAPTLAGDVAPGDRVRLPNGEELAVSRVDPDHLGHQGYVKLVEDNDERWLCYVMPRDRELEVERTA